jgi:hypothetical protein
MATASNIKVTISLSDTGLDEEELQAEVENLLPQLRELDGVEDANLVPITEAPQGSKAFGGFLWGLLSAELNPANLKALFGFLSDRFANKTIKMEVEVNGNKLIIEASSKVEFDFVEQKAQKFINSQLALQPTDK